MKRQHKQFDVAKEARRAARRLLQTVAGTRVIPDKRNRPPKHKKPFQDE
jgi:hypothetical protein